MCGPGPSSPEALIERFNEHLMRAVVQGRSCVGSQSWMDGRTTIAIEKVAAAHPNPDPALIEAARAEFAKQLDGTHRLEEKAIAAAEWEVAVHAFYPEWTQTPFAESVRSACETLINFMYHPDAWDEIDRAVSELDCAAAYSSGHRSRTIIIEQLRRVMAEVSVIPEYEFVDDELELDCGRFAQLTRNAVRDLVKSVEDPEDGDLDRARHAVETATSLRPGSSRTQRNRGIVVDHLRLILEGLGGGSE